MTRLKHNNQRIHSVSENEKLPKSHTVKKKTKGDIVLGVFNVVITLLLHVACVLLCVFSYQYYGLSKTTFVCALGILVCILIISDLLLFVGNNYNDKLVKISNIVLSGLLLVAASYGAFTMYKLSSSVNKMLENSGSEQYEEISVVFVSYDDAFNDIKDIEGKKVGALYETGAGTSSLGKEKLDAQNIDYDVVECSTTNDLFYGLIEGTIDVAIMPGSYRQLYENSDDYDYSEYLEKMNDFSAFTERVLVDENESANKDLTAEPFNILLIGFAQNSAESPYGLADTIIVATVNPQTMTVSMTSIPRDSFVPISCYGGSKDKINAARGTSRACLMETVSDLLGMDIDFYMEVNFEAVVDIVDALDGILIDSPVEFVGQNSSYTRGEMTVLVPAGPHYALGEEVLAFARERHAMPNGDFDRQKHQQEVIKEIARELINLRDVNKALKVMEACGDNISTNLSMEQLTGIFNYIISAPNYLGIEQFGLIDIHNMRLTGYSSWHYNEQLELPVWIYKLYNGSIEDITMRINETLDIYETYDQDNHFYYFAESCAVDQIYYKTEFDEEQQHENLPLYCPYLTTMTYAEADAWAQSNKLTLNVKFITTGYPESSAGMVVDQGTKYGKKLNAGDTVSITVFGIDESKCVPNFVGKSYLEAVAWAKEKGYTITLEEVKEGVTGTGGTVISQTPTAGSLIEKYNTLVLKYYAFASVDASTLVGKTESEVTTWVKANLIYPESVTYKNIITDDVTKAGKVASASFGTGSVAKSNDKTLTVTMYVKAQNYELKFVVDPVSSGTVSVDGIASTGGSYSNAKKIALSATAASTGYKFTGWYIGSELLSSNNPIEHLPSKAVTITAKFKELKKYSVSVKSSDAAKGTVTASAIEAYEGTSVTVTATPAENCKFVKWSDGDTNASRSITISDKNIDINAEFADKAQYKITATAGTGGTVTPGSITDYEGKTATFTATPESGYKFVNWSTGETTATITVSISEDKTITATFTEETTSAEGNN